MSWHLWFAPSLVWVGLRQDRHMLSYSLNVLVPLLFIVLLGVWKLLPVILPQLNFPVVYQKTDKKQCKHFQGYLTSWVEGDVLEMCLIKYFTRSKQSDWISETEVLSEISKHEEHTNLMAYRWHSEGTLTTTTRNLKSKTTMWNKYNSLFVN